MSEPILNPYEAPQTLETTVPQGKYPLATIWKRFFNWILDWCFIVVLAMVFYFLLEALSSEAVYDELELDDSSSLLGKTPLRERIMDHLMGWVISIFYYTLFEATTGRSLAKWITGSKVLTDRHTTPHFGQILGRSFARIIPFECFSVFSSSGLMWHDSLSGTITVDVRGKLRPPPRPMPERPLIFPTKLPAPKPVAPRPPAAPHLPPPSSES